MLLSAHSAAWATAWNDDVMTLQVRLTVVFAILTTVTAGLAIYSVNHLAKRQFLEGIDYRLDTKFEEIKLKLKEAGVPENVDTVNEAIREHTISNAAVFYFSIHHDHKGILFQSHNLENMILPDLTHGYGKLTFDMPKLGAIRIGEYYLGSLHLQIAISLRHMTVLDEQYRQMAFAVVPASFVVSFLLGAVLSRFLLRPLRVMQQTASRFSPENLDERIPYTSGKDELARLARLLNRSFDQLSRAFKQARQFTEDTSHELKTPLSLIRLHAESVQNDEALPAHLREETDELMEAILHLNQVVEKLLFLARSDSKLLPLKHEQTQTAAFITDFVEDAELLAASKGLRFRLDSNEKGSVTIDPKWIKQVIYNLLSNALKWSPKQGVVSLDSRHKNGYWCLLVMDEGPGVPQQELEGITGRFSRASAPGPTSTEQVGIGLGLAIAKSLLELHEGTLSYRNRVDSRGFEIGFKIPIRD